MTNDEDPLKNYLRAIPDSLLRIVVLFIAVFGVVFLIRIFVPDSLLDTELHKKETINRELANPIMYAGSELCAECHEETELKHQGYHRDLSCETCHGPSRLHTEDPGETKPVIQKLREQCSRCHIYHPSRPTGFPQINLVAHNPLKQCTSCHDPHDPTPPHIPQDCQACHAEIGRMKALSHHVQLECTTCHSVPREHRVTPRSVNATIPRERSFCGTCHAHESRAKDIPQIELSSHGEKYLCWQCHYPHFPEGR